MKRNRQFDELLAKVPEEIKRRVEKQMTCKWLRNGDECGKGLPGTPCEVVGCVAWEHYEDSGYSVCITNGVSNRQDTDLLQAARELIQAVEGYICPKKGDKYVFRNEVLAKVKEIKEILNR